MILKQIWNLKLNSLLMPLIFILLLIIQWFQHPELNHDLDKINKWPYQWKMAFNPEPNKQAVEVLLALFTHPSPLMVPVSKVNVHKYLGLNLDPKLSFVSHISIKQKRVLAFWSIKIFIRSHFDYCDVIYHIPHLTNPFESSITLNTLME